MYPAHVDGGMSQDTTDDMPRCVVCGCEPDELTQGFYASDEDAVEVNYPNDVGEADAAPDGTVWTCKSCRFDGE